MRAADVLSERKTVFARFASRSASLLAGVCVYASVLLFAFDSLAFSRESGVVQRDFQVCLREDAHDLADHLINVVVVNPEAGVRVR